MKANCSIPTLQKKLVPKTPLESWSNGVTTLRGDIHNAHIPMGPSYSIPCRGVDSKSQFTHFEIPIPNPCIYLIKLGQGRASFMASKALKLDPMSKVDNNGEVFVGKFPIFSPPPLSSI